MRIRSIIRSIIATVFIATSTNATTPHTQTAIFGGGCFWCMQPAFDNTLGVISTRVGYSGGHVANPTYEEVISDTTGHIEAIEVTYDPTVTPYEKLLAIYWQNIDPLDAGGQFADRGEHYHTVIFVADATQRAAAEKSKAELQTKFAGKPIATQILSAKAFYAAEDYHQKYYQKNAAHYNAYKYGSGRVGRLKSLWSDDGK